jgi:hypothetical protein
MAGSAAGPPYTVGIALAVSKVHCRPKKLLTNLFSRHYKGKVNWMSQCSLFE